MEIYVSRHEKKEEDKLDDEIKLGGLEALGPEELEKHLILHSNRLRTFEDGRLEIVTYVEAKCGLRIPDSKPSDTGSRRHADPWMLMRSILLSSTKGERVIESARWLFQVRWSTHFQRDCNARKSKSKQSKSWSMSVGRRKLQGR